MGWYDSIPRLKYVIAQHPKALSLRQIPPISKVFKKSSDTTVS